MAAAIALVSVGQTTPLVRQGQQRLGKHLPGAGVHGQLPLVCLLHGAGDSDDVSRVRPLLYLGELYV